jgi:hypothetical protein
VTEYQVPFSMAGLPVANHFVRREREMAQLEKFFGTDGDGDGKRRKVFVVHGLGGMGKTQLCVEYVRQHKEDFTAVFWLDGSSKDALRQSLSAASTRATRQGPSSTALLAPDAHDVDEAIAALHQWLSLEANTGWLLVLDNIDREWQGANGRADPEAYDFKDYLPPADAGCRAAVERRRMHQCLIQRRAKHSQCVRSCLPYAMLSSIWEPLTLRSSSTTNAGI